MSGSDQEPRFQHFPTQDKIPSAPKTLGSHEVVEIHGTLVQGDPTLTLPECPSGLQTNGGLSGLRCALAATISS
jgi:hypothetical protein